MPEDLDEDIRRLAGMLSGSERCVVMTGVRLGAIEDTEAKAAGVWALICMAKSFSDSALSTAV